MQTRKRGAQFGHPIGGLHRLKRFRTDVLQHRDRKGRRISLYRMSVLFNRPSYQTLARTTVGAGDKKVWISTVWLGFDTGLGGYDYLFETMIFGGPLDQRQWRYTIEREAKKGHNYVVNLVREYHAKGWWETTSTGHNHEDDAIRRQGECPQCDEARAWWLGP